MRVELLAAPKLNMSAAYRAGWTEPEDDPLAGDALGEIAGRMCYQSWARNNPATVTNAGYISSILRQQHYSVLEHAHYVFAVHNVSRALTHELVRHRQLGFSQRSQRYVEEAEGGFVLPLELQLSGDRADFLTMLDAHQAMIETYELLVRKLTEAGVPRKRARQAARYILPSGHTTELIVSGNLRAWREVLGKRLATTETGAPLADLEFFHLAQWLLLLLHQEAPNATADLWERQLTWMASGPDELLVIQPLREYVPLPQDLEPLPELHPSIPLADS